MKQTLKMTCIGLALIIMLAGCGSLVESTTNYVIGEGSGNGELVSQEKEVFKGELFQAIDVETDVMEIIVKQGDSDEATVELLKDDKISSELLFDAAIQNDVLHVKVETKDKILAAKNQKGERRLVISLPKDQEPALEIINNVGRVELDGVAVSQATVELDAGQIVTNEVAGKLELNIDTGEINVKKAAAEHSITANSDTGSVNIEFAEQPKNASYELQVDVGKVNFGIDDVNYEENRNTLVKAKRGNDGANIRAMVSVGSIHVK